VKKVTKKTSPRKKTGAAAKKDGEVLSGIRINRYFTENGYMSRREADRAIESGKVKINGQIAALGDRVNPGDRVMIHGKLIQTGVKRPVILAYHKPVGIECTTDQNIKGNIIDAVGYTERVFNIGRLDKMSEGLILLTNLGDIVNKILRSKFDHEKEYVVYTNDAITDGQITKLRSGIRLEEGTTLPCRVTRVNARCIRMVLTEGKNRQIRRMIEDIGLQVNRLKRVRIMHITLGDLPRGKWRKLTQAETKQLMTQISAPE
jgi:23S rRNA pseudouridine2604 synthase